jgi:hypothetical protein
MYELGPLSMRGASISWSSHNLLFHKCITISSDALAYKLIYIKTHVRRLHYA